jgi:two-component system nitrate/nitrite sensor histidine kinase NarX
MLENHQKLSNKIIGILVVFFLVATTAIGMTLLISWQLEGAAAAINDAGSQRMRSYRIGYLLQKMAHESDVANTLPNEIRAEVAQFEKVLAGLERGDPLRPLFLPRDEPIQTAAGEMRYQWDNRMRPLILSLLETDNPARHQILLNQYHVDVGEFVGKVNALVLMMEKSYAHNTNILRSFQLGLVLMALIGTVALIYYFFALVVRPVQQLQEGIGRMAGEDFDVRLPVASRDEFGSLAEGFNRMANHLSDLYATLEQRVDVKTRTLEEKNHELSALYEIAAFLNEPATVEDLCRGFIQRVIAALGAQGGAVRVFDGKSQKLFLLIHEGLSEEFVRKEATVCSGECICGESVRTAMPLVADISRPPPNMTLMTCQREGFQTASAFTIRYKKSVIGIYNLYFTGARQIAEREIHLLEILGQHLGVAVENQRLVSRDKELAVSEERNLLAQELHDSIAQGLAFLNIKVQLLEDSLRQQDVAGALEEAANIREGVQESYDDVRELLVHFRTRVQEADLEAAIRGALQKFEGQTGIATRFEHDVSGAPLPAEYETQMLHIVQESLSNIRKHARASAVSISLEHRLDDVIVTVRDNGIGFDAVARAGEIADQHVGLKIMMERAHRIGGRFQIQSQPGDGTLVRLVLPGLRRDAA